MKAREIKVARIGNSRGVRLPAESLRRYRIGDSVLMEELADGILLRPVGSFVMKMSWPETAAAMAAAGEDWTEWEAVDADGLENVPWESGSTRRGREGKGKYAVKPRAEDHSLRSTGSRKAGRK